MVGLQAYKHPIFPGLKYEGGQRKSWTADFDYSNEYFAPFMEAFDYHPRIPVDSVDQPDDSNYYVEFDWKGPLYLFPGQCMVETSWMVPRQSSPIIAYVNHDNDVTKMVAGYFNGLADIQNKEAGAVAPHFRTMPFATEEDLFDYMTSEYYGGQGHKGVCFAYSAEELSYNNYDVKFYFNDLALNSNPFSNGIPSQSNPVWEPNTVKPDMNSFEIYQRRGYSVLHSIMANSILKAKTKDNDANIAIM